MRIPFPNFESSIDSTILDRGENMYQDDAIDSIDTIGPGKWGFNVTSERVHGMNYEVTIHIRNGRVTYHDCDCPYDFGPVCKHVVACLYEIRDTGLYGGQGRDDDGRYSDSEEDEDFNEDEEDEEETDDEGDTSAEVDKILAERKIAKEAKERQIAQNKTSKVTIVNRKEGEDFVENEFHCQVCLEAMDDPVLMSCNAHSMCYDCALLMFKHNPKQAGGYKFITCPTCRESSGFLKVKKVKDIKINLEMKRIKEAYDNEKRAWSQEKETLQEIVSQVENNSQEGKRVKVDCKKKKKNSGLEKEIDEMDTKQLQEMAGKILIKLKSKGVKIDQLVHKVCKHSSSKEEDEEEKPKEEKSKRLKRKAENITNITNKENTDNAEDRYPLRNLKRTKTTL